MGVYSAVHEIRPFLNRNSDYLVIPTAVVGRDSSVGITTRYKLDGKVIESRWGQVISSPFQNGPGALYKGVPSNRLGHDVDHQPTASAAVKERVDLYLYSPSGPSWLVLE